MANSKAGTSFAEKLLEPEHLRKMYIGGLNQKTDDAALHSYFSNYGEVVKAFVVKDKATKTSRRFGFVIFSKSSSIDLVQKQKPHLLDGQMLETLRAISSKGAYYRTDLLYVEGITSNINDKSLREYFKSFGQIESIEISTEDSAAPHAIIGFDNYDEVDKALVYGPHVVNGECLKVRKANKTSKQELLKINGDGTFETLSIPKYISMK